MGLTMEVKRAVTGKLQINIAGAERKLRTKFYTNHLVALAVLVAALLLPVKRFFTQST